MNYIVIITSVDHASESIINCLYCLGLFALAVGRVKNLYRLVGQSIIEQHALFYSIRWVNSIIKAIESGFKLIGLLIFSKATVVAFMVEFELN